MTALADLITAVRRRVADMGSTPVYADPYYVQSLTQALEKLNFDWGTEYPTVEDVTAQYKFLLLKLATIEMCYVRSTEATIAGGGSVQTLTVPDLTLTKMIKAASDVWLDLAKVLQDEYDGELESGQSGGEPGGGIAQAKMWRQAIQTGGAQPYELAETPVAPTLAGSVTGTVVSLWWTPVLSTMFWQIELWRAANVEMTSGVKVHDEYEIHTEDWEEVGMVPGSYWYQLVWVDTNGLRGYSNVLPLVVV